MLLTIGRVLTSQERQLDLVPAPIAAPCGQAPTCKAHDLLERGPRREAFAHCGSIPVILPLAGFGGSALVNNVEVTTQPCGLSARAGGDWWAWYAHNLGQEVIPAGRE